MQTNYGIMKFRAKVYAKINLNLKITGMRGKMHTIDSLMHSVDIFDTVTMTVGESGVYMNGTESPDNIVCKVVEEYKKLNLPPIRFDIEKGIPMESGLGGSSADASCAIRLIERAFGETLNPMLFGSDVHFMLTGGLSRVENVGESLTDYDPLDLILVVAKGTGGVSTKDAYSKFDEIGQKTEKDCVKLIDFLKNNDYELAKDYLFNDLQSVSEIINPEVERVVREMKKFTPCTLMSGSGSAVFGIFQNEEDAKDAFDYLSDKTEYVKVVRTKPFGIEFVD